MPNTKPKKDDEKQFERLLEKTEEIADDEAATRFDAR